MSPTIRLGAALALLLCAAQAHAEDNTVAVADYQHAEAMLQQNLRGKLRNIAVDPIWLPDGNRFWYKHESASGWDYVAIDPDAAARSAAFDHVALAAAVSAVLEKPVDAAHLPLEELRFTDSSAQRISFAAQASLVACDLVAASCKATKRAPANTQERVSPDGKRIVFARNDNLFVREVASGKERQVTHDGVAHFAYGKMPDGNLLRVLSDTRGFALPMYGIEWAPDSRHVVATRMDERAVADYPFLQLAPYNGDRHPHLTMVRSPLSGLDKPPTDVAIVDTVAATVKHLPVGADGLSTVHYWDPSGKRFLALQGGDYTRTNALYEVAVPSGTVRKIAGEDSKTFLQAGPLVYDAPAFHFLAGSNEMIWFSQRDGWNHFYLVDFKTGAFKPITRGDWNVQNIVRVDEKARRIYFTGAGREKGENPYWRHLYVASFDGDVQNLTPEPADHAFAPAPNPLVAMLFGRSMAPPSMIAPSGRYFVDTISTVNQPPVIVLKRIDGSEVMKLETADVSEATAIGFVTPEPFSAKAADGKTDLYGWILQPPRFDASRRYPVIDAIYNGPQVVTTPHDFVGATRGFASDARAFAQLGFVVVMLDSRGTPMRSKAFQDHYFNNLGELGLEDHVAAIKEVGATRPWMDLDRVGLYGHSFGGYAAMKGILDYPDFYKVSAASAGPYDLFGTYSSVEPFFAPAIYKDGAKKPTGPADRPTNWGRYDLTQDAAKLKGKLLIGYGDLDENAWPAVTARMVDALIAANKSFDLLYMPNRSHAFSVEPYFIRRRWDFFVRNLAGKEPPVDYAMGARK